MNKFSRLALSGLMAGTMGLGLAGCNAQGSGGNTVAGNATWNASAPVAEQRPSQSRAPYTTDALLFAGDGAAYDDPEALTEIMESHGLKVNAVSSDELDAMSLDEIASHGVIVWPGGLATTQSSSLTKATRERLKQAVQERGVSFVGICAGAFVAVSPDTSWGFSIIKDETLPYYHLEDEGTTEAMVTAKLPDGSSRELVWWGGPKLPEVNGGVIARYGDTNEPAIVQTWAGNGFVVLSGPHPEAPAVWLSKLGLDDADGNDHELMWQMIDAALNQNPMAAF